MTAKAAEATPEASGAAAAPAATIASTRASSNASVCVMSATVPVIAVCTLVHAWQQPTQLGTLGHVTEVFCALTVLLLLEVFFLPVTVIILWCCLGMRKEWLLSRRLAESSAVWLLWNTSTMWLAVTILFCKLMLPFSSYSTVFRVWIIFFTAIPAPIILMTGGLKVLVAKTPVFGNYGWKQQTFQASLMAPATLLLWDWALHSLPWQESRALLVMTLAHYIYVTATSALNPEVSGWRRWGLLHGFEQLWELAYSYFSMEVVFDGNDKCDEKKGCVIGFHPHGIIPYNAGLMLLHPSWKQAYPHQQVYFMTDGFTHAVPFMKDLIQWLGAREVSKEVINRVLGDGNTVMLVPGGQAEIMTTRSWGNDVCMDRRHKGFVRVSLSRGVPLLPVLSMGEWMMLDNIYCPRLQALSRRWLGFPCPFLPYGAFPLMPRRWPVRLIVGEPVPCPEGISNPPTQTEVDEQHQRYFDQLESMFQRHKVSCGFGDKVLRWI
jgi:hypothetical protein